MTLGVVLAAAGAGSRMGTGEKKQFVPLAGVPLLLRALLPFAGLANLVRAAVVLPAEDLARGRFLLSGGFLGELPTAAVAGGPTRQDSVRIGLDLLPEADLLLIHDAARPLVTRELILRTVEAAAEGVGAVPALPISDTLKRDSGGTVRTVARTSLYSAQTPQAFPREMIVEVHRRAYAAGEIATDDAALCERYGYPVRLVAGETENVKIATEADLRLAEALLAAREATTGRAGKSHAVEALASAAGERPETGSGVKRPQGGLDVRTGIGCDVHRLEAGRACILGGVRIDSASGPAGHSDADVLVHAIMDALLGAAGEPDIGHRFPEGDPRYAGADSLQLLAQVRAALVERFEILFVDSVVMAEAPRLGPHVAAMRRRISDALGIAPERVNVKATTAERLGAIGRGEGIAAQAIATLWARA